MSSPSTTQALVLRQSPADRKPLFHDVLVDTRAIPTLQANEVLVQVHAVSLNHRDLWIRKGMYPAIAMNSILGSDAVGNVISAADPQDPLLNRRVFFVPMRGWENDALAPETNFGILGGVRHPSLGVFSQYVVVSRDQVILAPEHIDGAHLAAWPLGGVTSWRAVSVNGEVKKAHNVLITGIGGGVALLALQLCLAKGANVYVTSGNEEKINKAIALGAKAGFNYKKDDWPVQLEQTLKKSNAGLDVIIDSGGGNILSQTSKVLKAGGRLVCYGMTASPQITFTMRDVLKNYKLMGSTMGSHKDLVDATNFITEHKIVPIISHVFEGLSKAEEAFQLMERGDQFGKIVIRLDQDVRSNL